MNRDEIARLTQEYGGNWGTNHAKRLLHLVSIIGEGMEYDEEAVWLAAYLHDWGGYQPWVEPGVEHDAKSVEVVGDFLARNGFAADLSALVLECIRYHHGGSPDRSIESKLLTDADALDLLGVVGTLRVFSMVPRNLRGAYEATKKWRQRETAAISFDKTRELAAKRIEETDQLLQQLEEETFGLF
jgi:uncharacterized protein